jgi:hypothetical protein
MRISVRADNGEFSQSNGGDAVRILMLGLTLMAAASSFGQSTNSGDIRGTASDTSGAVIPGVIVSVVDVDTGVSKDYVTNGDGLYDTSSIVAGHYTLHFRKQGFEDFVRGPISLEVGVTTVNAQMAVGSSSQTVTVTSDVPLLQTESGDQTTTLESKDMEQLPQVTQDWENFMILLPGTSGAAASPQGSSNPGQTVSSNGNLPYNNILADGASTTLSQSENANPSVFETVGELQVSLSSFSAQYGVGGLIINEITKGGTDRFHGSAYEYLQNDDLNATEYGFGNPVPVPFLRFDNFGGSIGGPILKKKMFFFFDYDQILHHGSASNSYNTVPTAQVMSGDFSGQPTIYDPTSQTIAYDSGGNPYPVRKSFESEYGYNGFPSSIFDTVAAKVQQLYPTPSNHIAGSQFVPGTLNSSGLLQNNFFSSLPNSIPYRKYFGRLDYDITPNNRLTLSALDSDTPTISPSAVFACPVGCQTGDGEDWNNQATDVWNISNKTINEARLGYTLETNYFIDPTVGKGYPAQLGLKYAEADDLPSIIIGGTNPYVSVTPNANAISKDNVFDPSDVVTMVRGKHILHFGGEMLIYRNDSTAWGNINSGTFNFSGQYTQNWVLDPTTGLAAPDATTGLVYADFLLGLDNSWNAAFSPEYGGRLKSPQLFVQDDYKVLRNLTVNLGLRYQINHGWNEVHGNEDSFDQTIVNPATNTLGAEWYGNTHANGRTALQANVFSTVMPRFGFSWLLKPNMTLRGGFGLYSYNWSLDTYGNGMGGPFGSTGNLSDQSNGITPMSQLDGPGTIYGTSTPLPYSTLSADPTRFNGQAVLYNQYHTPVPKIYEWNLAVERQLSANYMAEISYVGSHGFDLNFPTDLNEVPTSYLSSNDQQYRPYPQYQGIAGSTNNAISNYNSMQASITKRMSSGISMSFNYVWSHFLDDQDSSGWGGRAGPQPFQIGNNPAANYSNSSFDVRNAFKGYIVYQLPFGRGKMLLNTANRALDEVVGGWQISGTLVLSSGNPFTVYSTQNTFSQAGSAFPNWSGVSPIPRNKSINDWYNPAAFSLPADGTFGDVRRNSLFGPGLEVVNLSGGKTFSLPWEGINLQIRGDATNAFNHASFGLPQSNLSGAAAVGQPFTNSSNITSTTVGGRQIQLGAHLSF